jgi:hypothetical protein
MAKVIARIDEEEKSLVRVSTDDGRFRVSILGLRHSDGQWTFEVLSPVDCRPSGTTPLEHLLDIQQVYSILIHERSRMIENFKENLGSGRTKDEEVP